MRAPRLALIALALLGCALATQPVHAADADPPAANAELLYSARVWESRARDDLARLALDKLVAARPDRADFLLLLGELDLRMDDAPAARGVLERLQREHASAAATATFATELRVHTRDRLQWASIERLVELRRFGDARSALARLFPAGPPDGTLGIDYFRLLARIPGQETAARAGLARLAAAHADDPRYALALYRAQARDTATAAGALRALLALARRPDMRTGETLDALRAAAAAAGYARIPLDLLREYLRLEPADAQALASLTARARTEETQRLRAADALRRVLPQYQVEGIARLQQAVGAQSADLQSAVTLWLDQGGPAPAAASIHDAGVAAAFWAARAEPARAHDRLREAASLLEAARAFAQRDFEAVIAPADALTRLGADADADALAMLRMAGEFAPQSAWLLETRVRWLVSHDRPEEALRLLDERGARAAPMAGDAAALRASVLDKLGQRALAAGDAAGALEDFAAAHRLAPLDPWIDLRLAQRYAALGDSARGRQLFEAAGAQQPGDPDLRYAQALYLDGLDAYADSLAALQAVPFAQWSAGMLSLRARVTVSAACREARALRSRGDLAAARRALAAAEAYASEPDAARELAQAWDDLGEPERALALLRRQLDAAGASPPPELLAAWNRIDRGLRRRRADAAATAGDWRAARDGYAALVAELPEDPDLRFSLAKSLARTGERAQSLRQLDTVARLARADGAWGTLLGAAWLARAEGAYARAYDDFSLVAGFGTPEQAANARAELARLEQRRESWTSGGVQVLYKPGDPGISAYRSLTVPLEWRLARGFEGHWFAHADAIHLDAGRLPRSFDGAGLLGSVALAGPAALATLRDPDSAQSGLALAGGFQNDRFEADLGTTPLGFLTGHVVGGVSWTPTFGAVDVTLGVARRPVTSSLLSYAGMRDPASGKSWGGVVATGPRLQAGHYGERFSVSGSVELQDLRGTHVLSNTFTGGRLAADWRIWGRSNLRLYAGAAATVWHYRQSLLNYTYGSGGYYSPQSYRSLSLPLEFEGSARGFSFQLRFAVAYNRSLTRDMPFFPDDPALQAAAAAAVLPAGYSRPIFGGGTSVGTSISSGGAVERQVARGLVLGLRYDLDRSDYYHPTALMLYFRHAFSPHASTIVEPPGPPRSYAEF